MSNLLIATDGPGKSQNEEFITSVVHEILSRRDKRDM
jgi:hypothetical protein